MMAEAGTARVDAWRWGAGLALAAGGLVLFQGWGNATRGYIDTGSVFVWWMSQWFNDASDSEHGPLVLLLSLYLLYYNLKRWPQLETAPRLLRGGIWLAGAVALNALGFFVQETRLNILAVLTWLQGMAWLLGGARWGRAAGFPLLLLLFSIPLSFVQDIIGAHLRYAVIASVHGLTDLLGMEVQRVGTVLSSPGRDYVYDVAPACSGIRSLLVVGVLSLVTGYFMFQRWWRRGLLLALALPFAFVGNLLRVFLIVLAGHHLGSEWGLRVHDFSGFVVFAVVLGLALFTAQLLEKYLPEKPVAIAASQPAFVPSRFRWSVLAGVLLLAGLSVAALEPLKRQDIGRLQVGLPLTPSGEVAPLPDILPGPWLGIALPMSEAERQVLPEDTGFARALYRSLSGEQVLFTEVLSGLDRSSIHRPEICLRAQGWEIRRQQRQTFVARGDEWPATVMLAQRPGEDGNGVTYALLGYWFVSARDEAGTHQARRLLDLQYRLRGEAHRWAYVLVQTPLSPQESTEAANGVLPAEALQRLAGVGTAVREDQAN